MGMVEPWIVNFLKQIKDENNAESRKKEISLYIEREESGEVLRKEDRQKSGKEGVQESFVLYV